MMMSPIYALYGCLFVFFILVAVPIMCIKKRNQLPSCRDLFIPLAKVCFDLDFAEVFDNLVDKRVVRNDSKEAQTKRDAFYKKQSFACNRLTMDKKSDCMICSQPIQDDEMVVHDYGVNWIARSSCMKEYF